MPQGPPNPGFMQEKVQKGDFLKKPSRELNFLFCFKFIQIPQRPGTLNQKRLVFLPSKNPYKQCVIRLCKCQMEMHSACMSNSLKFPSHIDMIEQLCNIKRADVLGFTKMVKCRFIQQNTLLDFLVRQFFLGKKMEKVTMTFAQRLFQSSC